MRRGFTLSELMIVITIMAILAGLGFSAFTGTMNLAREQRTRSEINRINGLIMEKWESYRTRAVPITISPTTNPSHQVNPLPGLFPNQPGRGIAMVRLLALRVLMRMEMPDRKSDIVNPTTMQPEVAGFVAGTVDLSAWMGARPSLTRSYLNKAMRFTGGDLSRWTQENEGAECLYLILSAMRDGDKSALDYFDSTEVGDTDGDGMPEILDGWGTPIGFIRWPVGYVESATFPGSETMQIVGPRAPDPFDPAKVDPHWNFTPQPFALYPLIYSAGRDKSYDIVSSLDPGFRYAVPPAAASGNPLNLPNDPYFIPAGTSLTSQVQIGTPMDVDGDGFLNFSDNITNQATKE